jgi:MerR family transcriptional regulator, mercuric resistance operon regulatory protein
VLRVIKAAQRLGFSLEEIAELIAVGGHHHGGADASLQARASEKLREVETRIADLQEIRLTLMAAIDAGCDDLIDCAGSDCCPLPFEAVAVPIAMRPEHPDRMPPSSAGGRWHEQAGRQTN